MPHTTRLTDENKAECAIFKQLLAAEKSRTKLTHSALGKQIGLSGKSITAMANGRMRISVLTARKLCKVFKVPLCHILPWTAGLAEDTANAEMLERYRDLSPEHQQAVTQMIHSLLTIQKAP